MLVRPAELMSKLAATRSSLRYRAQCAQASGQEESNFGIEEVETGTGIQSGNLAHTIRELHVDDDRDKEVGGGRGGGEGGGCVVGW